MRTAALTMPTRIALTLAATAAALSAICALAIFPVSPAQAASAPAPGCAVSKPAPHLIAGRRVSVSYYFSCNNPRIRYVKATLVLRYHRPHWADAVVKSYMFDRFADPRRAAINAPLQTDGPCIRGKKYHGDITINVMLSATEMSTHSVRGPSIQC